MPDHDTVDPPDDPARPPASAGHPMPPGTLPAAPDPSDTQSHDARPDATVPLTPGGAGALATRSSHADATVILPGYAVEAELGRGGMGVVYRATQRGLNRPVAVKMVHGAAAADAARFLAEAEAVGAVDHPHVVRVFEFGEYQGRPYLAMEYLPGGTLADRLRGGGRLAPRDAAALVAKVARGVQAAHDRGVVHRDLKPSNVLFDGTGEPKVTDFGLAKVGGRADLTTTGAVLGTPAYMSPEQARGKAKAAGPATDVYALGVILYELLTGRRPFDGEDVLSVIRKVAEAPPPPVRKAAPGVPADLEAVCLRCLAKDPARRYPTAKDLADDLARFLAGEPVSAHPPRPAGCVRRHPVGAAGAGLLVVAVLAVLTWMATRPGSPPPALPVTAATPDGAAQPVTPPAEPAVARIDVPPGGSVELVQSPAARAAAGLKRTKGATPDLVYTIGPPAEAYEKPRVAFVGPDSSDIGALSIVIDASSTMGALKDPDSKISRVLRALEKVLRDLPDGTYLSLRAFGVSPLANEKVDAEPWESVFTAGGSDLAGNQWPPTFDRRLTAPGDQVNWARGRVWGNLRVLMSNVQQTRNPADDKRFRPIVRTMLHAAKEDFKGVPPGRRKVLLVLTDGVDPSAITPKNDPKGELDYSQIQKALVEGFQTESCHVHIVMIAEEAGVKEAERFKKQFKEVIEAVFSPRGHVTVLSDAGKLAAELAVALRPRVFLRPDDPGAVLPPRTAAGVPIKFDNWDPPEPPDWDAGVLPARGSYRARVGLPPGDGGQWLEVDRGDRLLVTLSRQPGSNDPVWERAVWGQKFLAPELARRGRTGWQKENRARGWLLTAAGYRLARTGFEGENLASWGAGSLDLLAAVENTNEALVRGADGNPVRQITPWFTWWEVAPAAPIPPNPLYVWQEHGHPAPTWRLRRRDWVNSTNAPPPAVVKAWVVNRSEFRPEDSTVLAVGFGFGRRPDGSTWSGVWDGKLRDGRRWTATFASETHGFTRSADSSLLVGGGSLVVRVYLDDPKATVIGSRPAPLFVRVEGAGAPAWEEHRFFRAAGAYTGYFHLPTGSLGREFTISLYSVGTYTAPQGPAAAFELPLPAPRPDDDMWPVRIGASLPP